MQFPPQVFPVAVHILPLRFFLALALHAGQKTSSSDFFTYSSNGMQLFMGGGYGNQFGCLADPVAIACFNDDIVIADGSNKLITIYETTEYASSIISAQLFTLNSMSFSAPLIA